MHQQRNTSGHQRYHNEPQTDESNNRNAQNERAREGRMTDILNVNPQQQSIPETSEDLKNRARNNTSTTETAKTAKVSGNPTHRVVDHSDALIQEGKKQIEIQNRLQINMMTDRRVEESRDQGTSILQIQRENEQAEQTEDPFRSVRSFS